MITPIELQSKTFKSGFGYDKKDVENFMLELQHDYEHLYKQNMELNDKINTLNEGLTYYKTVEKTIQKALVLAEQTAEETKESAKKVAKGIEAEAKANAQMILADVQMEYNRLREQTIHLMRQYESYKAQFKHLAAAQLELLESDTFHIQMGNLELFKEETHPVEHTEAMTEIKPKNKNHNYEEKESAGAFSEVAASNEDDFEFLDIE